MGPNDYYLRGLASRGESGLLLPAISLNLSTLHRGASLKVNRIQVKRDIYYIATRWLDTQHLSDYEPPSFAAELKDGTRLPGLQSVRQLFSDPSTWPRLLTRQSREGHSFSQGLILVAGSLVFVLHDVRH